MDAAITPTDRAAPKPWHPDGTGLEVKKSFCRVCVNFCAIEVGIDNGVPVSVTGDRSDPLFGGHTCAKGRAQPQRMTSPERLLQSLQRAPDGSFRPIAVEDAMDEIAARLQVILDRHGPRAIATYIGTAAITSSPLTVPFSSALMASLKSPMFFTPNTIDKPGKDIAAALHGSWQAPPQGFDAPDVALLIGINPVVSYAGTPTGSPSWLGDQVKRGMQLIVIDPRRSETAARATLHVQPRPGFDAAIIAALIRVILTEGLYDEGFVAAETSGLAELWAAVQPFEAAYVARLSDVRVEDLYATARAYAGAKRAYAVAGTGSSMSGHGSLVEYLLLDLQTLCGRWLRAGEQVRNVATFLPLRTFRAQASQPRPASGFGEPMRIRGLEQSPAGMPTAAAAEEMLLEGRGRIRALLSVAGNPAAVWPDQRTVVRALNSLELLVQVDPVLSQTARLAHFVIAPKMNLEVCGATSLLDFTTSYTTGYGLERSYANYTDAIVDPPTGSDLIEDWEFCYGLAKRLGLGLSVRAAAKQRVPRVVVNMQQLPTAADLLQQLYAESRIPLDLIRSGGGQFYPDDEIRVQPKEVGWTQRLQLADPDMITELAGVQAQLGSPPLPADSGQLRMTCRRSRSMVNSWVNDGLASRGERTNPAYLSPIDFERNRLERGDVVHLAANGIILHVRAEPDRTLRPGTVSITHAFGGLPDDPDSSQLGANVSALLRADELADRWSGQPRMSNVAVTIARCTCGPSTPLQNCATD